MDWRGKGSKRIYVQNERGELYEILTKRNGKFYVEASKVGGATIRLPFNEFETREEAMAWVEEREAAAEKRRLQSQNEPRITF